MTKICSKCKKELPISSFYRNGKKYTRCHCKFCMVKSAKEWKDNNPERTKVSLNKYHQKGRYLKIKYNISLEDIPEICQVCGLRGDKKRICVDHCHSTGKVRGFLCNNCNTALGMVKDDIAILERLAGYLRRSLEST